MARRLESDRLLFGSIVALVLFGALMVYSASAVMAAQQFNSSYHFFFRQLLWAGLGMSFMFWIMGVDYHQLARPQVVFPVLGLQLLMLVLVFFSPANHNAHRWFNVGPLNFQPSEFSKVAMVIFLAYFLDQRREEVNDWKHTLFPVGLVVCATVALVVKEPDFGTALAIALVAAAMLFAAGTRLKYFGFGALTALPVVYLLIFHVGYRYKRVLAFLHPYADPLGAGFQIIQSTLAVGTGGIDGVGLMEGHQKLFYLPEPHTDFIFAVIGEELGLLGCVAVVALFAVILWRGLRAAGSSPDDLGKLLALGITVLVVGQALVNISVVLGLLPTKGIALPLVSYGGSSLVMNLLALGILLNISQHAT